MALTYGFISAFGQSIALIPTMTIGMRWFPKRRGLAMGIVVGGFGGGAFIFNQVKLKMKGQMPLEEYFYRLGNWKNACVSTFCSMYTRNVWCTYRSGERSGFVRSNVLENG